VEEKNFAPAANQIPISWLSHRTPSSFGTYCTTDTGVYEKSSFFNVKENYNSNEVTSALVSET
jgi:hypothetical protein